MADYHFAEAAAPAGSPLLVLLHGTGGDENDLIALGREVMPGAHLIAPRGDVSEGGSLRFFKRLGMGVFDMDDLARATDKLGAFVAAQAARLKPASVYALGYSNGANILASLLFADPGRIERAVLMHPLIPFDPPPQPGLAGRKVLITAGRIDPMAEVATTERLGAYFERQGAQVDLAWHDGGHEMRPTELAATKAFLG
ncbi:MAG: alpha/beta hydrolase [Devosia sp.]